MSDAYLMALWCDMAGVPLPEASPDLETLRKTEWSQTFENAMRARMVVGAMRFGPAGRVGPHMPRAEKAIRRYLTEHNLEDLVDAANYLMLEFMAPSFSDAHFTVRQR